jgi:nucleoside-diphosphate-sugar epimerase
MTANRVLVTGSSGFIGAWLVDELKRYGHEVVGLDTVMPAKPLTLDEFIACDICDKPALLSVVQRVQPDAIVHLAARTDLEETRNLQGYAANIDGVRNLVEAVSKTPAVRRVIYTSSQLVCRVGYVPKGDEDYCPNTRYGESKVLTETITRAADGGGTSWCLARPTTVWGPHMSAHYQSMLRYIVSGQYFHCGREELFKSYVYAGNIAYQYRRLLNVESSMIHRQTFYLSDYAPLSLRSYTDGLARELGAKPIPTMPLIAAKALAGVGDALNFLGFKRFPFNSFRLNNIRTEYIFDLSKTQAVCGPLPFTQEQGIRETARWFLATTTPSRDASAASPSRKDPST